MSAADYALLMLEHKRLQRIHENALDEIQLRLRTIAKLEEEVRTLRREKWSANNNNRKCAL